MKFFTGGIAARNFMLQSQPCLRLKERSDRSGVVEKYSINFHHKNFFFLYLTFLTVICYHGLQDDFIATSSYEMHTLPTLSQHPLVPQDGIALGAEPSSSTVGTGSSATLSGSYSLIKRMKNVLVKQASLENLEKATALLRSAYVFYRDSFSGPFPSGINLYLIQPGKLPNRVEGATSSLPGGPLLGVEPLDISTPRKLLIWAFTLVHGRTGGVAEAVKYCEEQAKVRSSLPLYLSQLFFASVFSFSFQRRIKVLLLM